MRNYDSIQHFVNQINEGEMTYKNGRLYKKDLIKGYKRGKGQYLALSTRINGKKISATLHSIIFAYFHGIEELKKHETIDHINGDKYDNRIENLQGLTRRENSKKSNPNMLSIDSVKEIKKRLEEGETNSSLGRIFGVSNVTISKIKRGLRYRSI